mgnify:CR=1 FL=1
MITASALFDPDLLYDLQGWIRTLEPEEPARRAAAEAALRPAMLLGLLWDRTEGVLREDPQAIERFRTILAESIELTGGVSRSVALMEALATRRGSPLAGTEAPPSSGPGPVDALTEAELEGPWLIRPGGLLGIGLATVRVAAQRERVAAHLDALHALAQAAWKAEQLARSASSGEGSSAYLSGLSDGASSGSMTGRLAGLGAYVTDPAERRRRRLLEALMGELRQRWEEQGGLAPPPFAEGLRTLDPKVACPGEGGVGGPGGGSFGLSLERRTLAPSSFLRVQPLRERATAAPGPEPSADAEVERLREAAAVILGGEGGTVECSIEAVDLSVLELSCSLPPGASSGPVGLLFRQPWDEEREARASLTQALSALWGRLAEPEARPSLDELLGSLPALPTPPRGTHNRLHVGPPLLLEPDGPVRHAGLPGEAFTLAWRAEGASEVRLDGEPRRHRDAAERITPAGGELRLELEAVNACGAVRREVLVWPRRRLTRLELRSEQEGAPREGDPISLEIHWEPPGEPCRIEVETAEPPAEPSAEPPAGSSAESLDEPGSPSTVFLPPGLPQGSTIRVRAFHPAHEHPDDEQRLTVLYERARGRRRAMVIRPAFVSFGSDEGGPLRSGTVLRASSTELDQLREALPELELCEPPIVEDEDLLLTEPVETPEDPQLDQLIELLDRLALQTPDAERRAWIALLPQGKSPGVERVTRGGAAGLLMVGTVRSLRPHLEVLQVPMRPPARRLAVELSLPRRGRPRLSLLGRFEREAPSPESRSPGSMFLLFLDERGAVLHSEPLRRVGGGERAGSVHLVLAPASARRIELHGEAGAATPLASVDLPVGRPTLAEPLLLDTRAATADDPLLRWEPGHTHGYPTWSEIQIQSLGIWLTVGRLGPCGRSAPLDRRSWPRDGMEEGEPWTVRVRVQDGWSHVDSRPIAVPDVAEARYTVRWMGQREAWVDSGSRAKVRWTLLAEGQAPARLEALAVELRPDAAGELRLEVDDHGQTFPVSARTRMVSIARLR